MTSNVQLEWGRYQGYIQCGFEWFLLSPISILITTLFIRDIQLTWKNKIQHNICRFYKKKIILQGAIFLCDSKTKAKIVQHKVGFTANNWYTINLALFYNSILLLYLTEIVLGSSRILCIALIWKDCCNHEDKPMLRMLKKKLDWFSNNSQHQCSAGYETINTTQSDYTIRLIRNNGVM